MTNDLRYLPDAATGRLEKKVAKKYFSAVGLGVFAFALIPQIAVTVIALILQIINEELLDNDLLLNILSLFCMYGLAFPVMFLCMRKLPKLKPKKEKLGVGNFFIMIMIMFTFTILGNLISIVIRTFMSFLTGEEVSSVVDESLGNSSFLINLIFVAIVAPIIEEVIFRKFMCDRLLPLGEGYTVLISGLIFGLIHGNFDQCFYATLVGFLFGYIYVKTGKLRYTIAAHLVTNLFLGVFSMALYEVANHPTMYDEVYVILANLGSMLITILELLGAIAGFVILIVMLVKKKIRFEGGLIPPPADTKVAVAWGNVGMILASVALGLILLLSLLLV